MRFASLRSDARDGKLVLVDARRERCVSTAPLVHNLQAVLDDWDSYAPALDALQKQLDRGEIASEPFLANQCCAPLPRAFEWIDASSYLNHVALARRARGAALPPDFETSPLVYQGGSSVLLGPEDALFLPDPEYGLDFEAELVVVLGDVPQGTRAFEAANHVRLVMLANDVTYRQLVPREIEKGFGFFQSKPATAFSPLAVTPDELGEHFHDGRAYLQLHCSLNEQSVGVLDTGPEMHFSFSELIAYISRTRAFCAGSLLGGGTVSNRDAARGVACLVERRMREQLEQGAPITPYLKPGDRVRIEAITPDGRSVFGAIEQMVTAAID